MRIFPAIDILEGGCVRLFKGDFEQKVSYHRDPLEIALEYQAQGAQYLHLVDLDGAKAGKLVNVKLLEKLASGTELSIDFGGGIKTKEDIKTLINAGAKQVSVGTSAVKDPEGFSDWLHEFGEAIILSADVNNGKIVIAGWQLETPFTISSLLERFTKLGLTNVACTDVSRDGTMTGPSIELYEQIVAEFPEVKLIASGGVSSLNDLVELKKTAVSGVIIGKALLDGKFTMKEALGIV